MSQCGDLLRRRFIAIATGDYEAHAEFPTLDVGTEVETLQGLFCSPGLLDRQFVSAFENLAANPTPDDIKSCLGQQSGFSDADALIVYVTGHGSTAKGRHRIVLAQSNPNKLATTSLDTISLIEWLAEADGLEQVFLILDLCEAGDVAFEVTPELDAAIPATWIALLATSAGADAKVGAFTGAVEEVFTGLQDRMDPDASELIPYLRSHDFIPRVRQALLERSGQQLRVLREPYSASCCLPNPQYDAGGGDRVATTTRRRDLALLEQDMVSHWRPRAPVTHEDTDVPLVFTGRRRLLTRLIDAVTGSPSNVVVTGRAGSGKSAALARLVTCSDPLFRSTYRDLLATVSPIPPEGSVDIAVLATGKGPEQIVQQIAGALDAEVQSADGQDPSLDIWLEAIDRVLWTRTEPLTVVLDALDEARDPIRVLRNVLQRLNPPDRPRLRLMVGVRSISEEQPSSGLADDLASIAIEALAADAVAVDEEPYWEPGDIQALVHNALVHGSSPFVSHPELAREVSAAIEEGSGKSYLIARLVATELASRGSPLAPSSNEFIDLLRGGVAEVVSRDLASAFPDHDERVRATILLRATALKLGRGLPWRDVWPIVASAISPDGRVFGDADIEWLLRHRMSGYLVRDVEDDVTVYRPFHEALRESLATDVGRFIADAEAHPDVAEAHRRIALALLPRFTFHSERLPPPYSRRHLVEHAVVAGHLGDPFLTAETLPLLDGATMSRVMRVQDADPDDPFSALLSAWRSVRHRWSWEWPDRNAAALDVALVTSGLDAPDRAGWLGPSWRPLWSEWFTGGIVMGTEAYEPRGLTSISFGEISGRPLVAAADAAQVLLWDAATSELVGPPIPVSTRQVAIVSSHDVTLVATGGPGGVHVWDAHTGRERWAAEVPDGYAHSIAAGVVDKQAVVASGSHEGIVTLFDALTGEPLSEFLGETESPFASARSLALVNASGRGRLVAGMSDGKVRQWAVDDQSEVSLDIDVGSEVNSVALIAFEGRLVLATGDSSGDALLWDADTGEAVGPRCQHTGEVRGVALAEDAGAVLLASGGFDRQAAIWDPFTGHRSSYMPHPGEVLDVEFGRVDGRLMLATACIDGNVRLWNPLAPGQGRVTSHDRIHRVAAADTELGPLLVGATEVGRVLVWRAGDGDQLAGFEMPPVQRTKIAKGTARTLDEVAIGAVNEQVVVAATGGPVVRAWDVEQQVLIGEMDWQGEFFAGSGTVAVADDMILVAHSAGDDAEVVDLSNGKTIMTMRHTGLRRVQFLRAASASVLAVVYDDGLELVDPRSGSSVWPRVRLPLTPWATNLALGDLDGSNVLAYWRSDGIGLWELDSGKPHGPGVRYLGAQGRLAMVQANGRDLLLSGHHATVRVWNPRTGRLVAELPFGTSIESFDVVETAANKILVAVSGPGVVVAELRLTSP